MASIALELEGPSQSIDDMPSCLSTTPPRSYGERIANMEDMRKNHQERVARIKREQRQKGTDSAEEAITTIKNEQ